MNKIQKQMIKEFQCPGCSQDSSGMSCCNLQELITVNAEKPVFFCKNHSAGTMMMRIGKLYLGMPKGFNRVGNISNNLDCSERTTNIRLFKDMNGMEHFYDKFNIPVWAMEKNGYLFVRSISPRLNITYIDVIKNGKIDKICPDTIDVGEFIDEID